MQWFRIAYQDGSIDECQFPSRSSAVEYAIHHGASAYEYDCGWRRITARGQSPRETLENAVFKHL